MRDVVGQFAVVLGVATFEVHGDGHFDGRRDTAHNPLGELDRDGLAVAVTLRLRDGPAARCDRLCARSKNRFGAAGIPRIVKQERRAFHVQLGEALGFFRLVHCILLS
jgi:hypothetical protein